MHEGTKNILRQAGLGNQVDNVEMGLCPLCGKAVDKPRHNNDGVFVSNGEFRDDLSIREFNISGLCQACQDNVFTPTDEEDV